MDKLNDWIPAGDTEYELEVDAVIRRAITSKEYCQAGHERLR